MAHHYCCRFNAFKVLDFILKTAYLEDPRNYVQFVNEPTVEGFTCLHLCAIWNAPDCLKLLLRFGGLNLEAKDNYQITPYLTAGNYKRADMKRQLKEYKDSGIRFLAVEHEKLAKEDIFGSETVDTDKASTKNVKPDSQNDMKGFFSQTEQEKKL